LRRHRAGRGRGGEEERKATGERLTSGTGLSVKEKENKKSRWRGLLRGESWWAARPPGQKGEEVSFLFFSFFKHFSNQTFKLKFKPSFFKLFTKFYNLFKSHISNQKPCKAK
jgi:hypothetical protein